MAHLYRRRFFLFLLILTFSNFGCATYHPKPLNKKTVSESLKPPDWNEVRIKAKNIHHPYLRPVQFNYEDGLNPDEAAILAVISNKELNSERDKLGLAQAQLFNAGLFPDPQFGYTMDFPVGGSTNGTVNAFGLLLNWDLNSLITRRSRIEEAKSNETSVQLDVAWKEWQVAMETELRIYKIYFLDKQLGIIKKEEMDLKENVSAIGKAVNSGDMTMIDLSASESALKSIQKDRLDIEKSISEERLNINELIGFPPDYNLKIQKEVKPLSLQNKPTYDDLADNLASRRLDIIALRMGYRSQEARVRTAILNTFPKINIGFAQQRDTGNVNTSGFGITIDLPIFNHNKGNVAIERATRQQLYDEYINRIQKARSNIAIILTDIDSVTKQIKISEQAVQKLKKLVDLYFKAFLEGNADIVTYYNSRNDLISKQLQFYKLQQDLSDLLIGLQVSTGGKLQLNTEERN